MRHAFAVGILALFTTSCSSKGETPAPASAGQNTPMGAGSNSAIVGQSPALNRPDPGPSVAADGSGAAALAAPRAAGTELARRAVVIRPLAADLRWKDIPWMGSVVEAQKTATTEKRPVLMWISDDDPLDRC